MNQNLEKRFEEIEILARKMGLDPFPVVFEEVPRDIIWNVASYGLPIRMGHWSFGRSYVHQKTYGEMGASKIYELILNNNPSMAFLDDTNDDVSNLLIAAHCYGHSDFFKHNMLFAPTNRNMINQAEQNARIIDGFKDKYGIDAVEDWMDIGFGIDGHIDINLGEDRQKYPPAEHVFKTKQPLPFADLFGESTKPQVIDEIKNDTIPPRPERDILWFLTNYAQMLPWQREVFSIMRSEAFYFYPQGQTKILNEGWASFWHAEILLNYWNLTPAEHLDFANAHSRIVCPGYGGSLNPYYVGFKILTDVKKRWDKYYDEGKKDAAFQKSDELEKRDEKDEIVMSKQDGYAKLFQIRTEEDDISFISNYLTRDLCEKLNLYTYGQDGNSEDPEDDDIIIKDRKVDEVRRTLVSRLHNNGVPPICIKAADDTGLFLKHDDNDELTLEPVYTQETLKYIFKVWKRPVFLTTHDSDGDEVKYEVGKDGTITEKKFEDGNAVKFTI
jgi:stage V sporulation protein R